MLKTLRDIRETIGSFISIVAVIIIGCFFFAGITAGSAAVTSQVNDYYASSKYATERAEYMYVNSPAVDEIAGADGVKAAAGYNTFNTQAEVKAKSYDIVITTLTDGIDEPYITAGALPGKNEIIVDAVTADKRGIGVGDKLALDIDTLKRVSLSMVDQGNGDRTPRYTTDTVPVHYEFTVSGIYHSPDVIYKVNMRNTSMLPSEFITAFVNYDDIALYTEDAVVVLPNVDGSDSVLPLAVLSASVQVFNGIKVISDGKFEPDELFGRYSLSSMEDIQEMFSDPSAAAGLYMYGLARDSFPAVVAFDSINDTIAALAAVLPFMFFAVAAAITVISLSKTVDNQRMQIGVIQALGVNKSAVYFSYIFYALFASLIGSVVGGVVGIVVVPMLIDVLYARQFSMPPTPSHVSVLFLILGIVVAAALASFAAFVSCHHTLKVKPAQAMRPKPPKKTKRILVERWTGLWKRLGFGAKMNLRNMFLHKTRMLLSSVGIIGCIALLIGLVGLKDNMDFSFEQYDASVGYDLTVVSTVPVEFDENFLDEVTESGYAGAEYVRNLTFVPNFSGRFTFRGKTADMTVMALPTAADAAKYSYADIDCVKMYTDDSGNNRLVFDENTFAIPTALADELGVKVGDTVSVSGYSLDNSAIAFDVKVTHIIYEYFEQKVYCGYPMFEKNSIALYADTMYVKVKSGVKLQTAIDTLEKYAEVRDARAFSDSFDTLKDKMSMLDYAVILFALGAAVLAIAVIYNITATNLKERTREIATLMVLGYKPRETANMLIVENMVITAIGCLIGLPLGYGLLMWLIRLTTSFNVYITDFLNWYVVIGCILLTFVFSLVATFMFNTRIKKISMVEALKSVE